MLVEFPEHTVEATALTVLLEGDGLTVTTTELEAEHPVAVMVSVRV